MSNSEAKMCLHLPPLPALQLHKQFQFINSFFATMVIRCGVCVGCDVCKHIDCIVTSSILYAKIPNSKIWPLSKTRWPSTIIFRPPKFANSSKSILICMDS